MTKSNQAVNTIYSNNNYHIQKRVRDVDEKTVKKQGILNEKTEYHIQK